MSSKSRVYTKCLLTPQKVGLCTPEPRVLHVYTRQPFTLTLPTEHLQGDMVISLMTSDAMFSGYSVETYFDETFTHDEKVRSPYASPSKSVRGLRAERISAPPLADRAGIFAPGDYLSRFTATKKAPSAPSPSTPSRALFPAEEWAHLEKGLIQRVRAINLLLERHLR